MIKEHRRTFRILRVALDLALVLALYYGFYGLSLRGVNPLGLVVVHPDYSLRLPGVLALVWTAAFLVSGAYDETRRARFATALAATAKILAFALVFFSLGIFLFKIQTLSRKFMLAYFLLCAAGLVSSKSLEFSLLRLLRRLGMNALSVILVGEGEPLKRACAEYLGHAEWGYRVAGVVGLGTDARPPEGLRSLGRLRDLPSILRTRIVDEVVYAAPPGRGRQLDLVLEESGLAGVRVRVLMDPAYKSWTAELDQWGGEPVLALNLRPRSPYLQIAKDLGEWVAALGLAILLSPVLLGIALLILATMGRPVLFKQKRAGQNGRVFMLYKFRTMIPEARQMQEGLAKKNQMSGPVFKIKDDPRVTRLGRLLRRSSLDELPQLLNVLKGELALVGPRPLAQYEARRVPSWAWRRYSVKPGITCLWQISGRNSIDFDGWMKLDLKYVDEWSPWLDLKIAVLTLPAILSSKGAY